MLTTDRLLLRPWCDSDREPFAAMNADPRVMSYFPATLTRAESDALIERCIAHQRAHGFSFFALELRKCGEFIGFTGIARPAFEAHFTPCVEIGWRLACDYWNCGYATEAARECLRFAFGPLGLTEVVAYTVPANLPSRRVMEKLGMTHDPADDFDHPRLAEGHPLRRHVLYRARRTPGVTSPSAVP
jgi:RimJ/RimL family protein N-acetyltransferase